jgi:hypothetical protein
MDTQVYRVIFISKARQFGLFGREKPVKTSSIDSLVESIKTHVKGVEYINGLTFSSTLFYENGIQLLGNYNLKKVLEIISNAGYVVNKDKRVIIVEELKKIYEEIFTKGQGDK